MDDGGVCPEDAVVGEVVRGSTLMESLSLSFLRIEESGYRVSFLVVLRIALSSGTESGKSGSMSL